MFSKNVKKIVAGAFSLFLTAGLINLNKESEAVNIQGMDLMKNSLRYAQENSEVNSPIFLAAGEGFKIIDEYERELESVTLGINLLLQDVHLQEIEQEDGIDEVIQKLNRILRRRMLTSGEHNYVFLTAQNFRQTFEQTAENLIGVFERLREALAERGIIVEALPEDAFRINEVPEEAARGQRFQGLQRSSEILRTVSNGIYRATSNSVADVDACVICYRHELGNGEIAEFRTLCCDHLFHESCFNAWLERNREHTCPYCRHQYVREDGGNWVLGE